MSAGALDRRVILGVFAFACVGVALVLANRWLTEQRRLLDQKNKEIMANYQAPIDVVVAARDVAEGSVLDETVLAIKVVPEKFVQPYAVRNPQELIGKVTIAPLAKDEQILLNKLRRAEEAPKGTTLSSVMPKGKRAVTIALDSLSGVGGFVRPGDVVDVLWTIRLPSPGQKEGEPVTFTLFQDVAVLAVGGEMVGRSVRSTSGKGEKEGNEFIVTLALTPQEISFLLLTREQGRIQLSLRPRADTGSQVPVIPANFNTLLEKQLGIKSQTSSETPTAPAAPRQVEVFKGLKRTAVPLTSGQ